MRPAAAPLVLRMHGYTGSVALTIIRTLQYMTFCTLHNLTCVVCYLKYTICNVIFYHLRGNIDLPAGHPGVSVLFNKIELNERHSFPRLLLMLVGFEWLKGF